MHLLSLVQEDYSEEPCEGNPSPRDGRECDGEGEGEIGVEGGGGATLEGEEPDIDELDPPKVLGDLLESVAGAIFVDSKMSLGAVWRVFHPHFQEKIGQYYKTQTHTHTHTHTHTCTHARAHTHTHTHTHLVPRLVRVFVVSC